MEWETIKKEKESKGRMETHQNCYEKIWKNESISNELQDEWHLRNIACNNRKQHAKKDEKKK